MFKKWRLWLFVFAAGFAGVVGWLAVRNGIHVVAAPDDPPAVAYVYRGNIYASMFREPYEILYFIMDDGEFFGFTTQEDSWVRGAPSMVVDYLERAGYKLGGIGICIHNHFGPVGFSDEDRRFYRYLRSRGFRGEFGIYYTSTGKCRWVLDDGGDK